MQILVRDPSLNIVDEFPPDVPVTLDAAVRANYADDITLSFSAAESRFVGTLTKPGYGVVLVDGGDILTSGTRTVSAPQLSAREATVTVSFLGDSRHIAGRLVMPPPSGVSGNKVGYYTIGSRPAESALVKLIADQMGTAARASWQLPGLIISASLGRGAVVDARARFDPLADVARVLAGDDFGFRIAQDSAEARYRFAVWPSRDMSLDVVFSALTGTLSTYTLSDAAPTTTRVVASINDDADVRTFREYVDTALESTWGAVGAVVLEKDTNDVDSAKRDADSTAKDYAQALAVYTRAQSAAKTAAATGDASSIADANRDVADAATARDQALTAKNAAASALVTARADFEKFLALDVHQAFLDGAAKTSLTLEPMGLPEGVRFGPTGDVWLMDQVGVEYADGVAGAEVLRAMRIEQSDTGPVTYTPTVGAPDAADPTPADQKRLARIEAALLRLLTQ